MGTRAVSVVLDQDLNQIVLRHFSCDRMDLMVLLVADRAVILPSEIDYQFLLVFPGNRE